MSSTEDKKVQTLLDAAVSKNSSYRGNPLLKREREIVEFTPEHIKEYKKCMADAVYFAEKYIQVVDVDKGLMAIELRDYQKRMIKGIQDNRFTVALAPRQIGKTTIMVCFLLWYILFNKDKKCVILANKGRTAQSILARLQLAYIHLPKFLQQGISEGGWNKQSINLENGSSVLSAATSSDSIRGESFSCVLVDECAFVRKGVWKEFASSTFPTISSGKETKMVLVSTPNGKNHFYEIWTKAIEKKSSFFPIRVDWWEVPGRDEKWKKEQIANTSQEQFDQEFGNSFLATSGTLIPSEHLVRIETEIKEPIQYSKDLKIYELPQYGHEYFCSVDCASTGKDYSTIQVIDISSKPWKQVAVYRNNVISHLVFPTVINMLGTKYNTASVLVENNEIGNTILHILNYEIEYDNIISTRINQKQVSLGQRTTTKTKSIGCQRLKDMISAEMITIVDFNTLTELRHFVQSKESYAAERGETDDLVMPLVNFAYFSSTEKFKYLFDKSFTEEFRNKYEEDIYESLAPMPMFNTTASEESENLDWLKN